MLQVTNLNTEANVYNYTIHILLEKVFFHRLDCKHLCSKSHCILGAIVGGSYPNNVTVYCYNGHITSTQWNFQCYTMFVRLRWRCKQN